MGRVETLGHCHYTLSKQQKISLMRFSTVIISRCTWTHGAVWFTEQSWKNWEKRMQNSRSSLRCTKSAKNKCICGYGFRCFFLLQGGVATAFPVFREFALLDVSVIKWFYRRGLSALSPNLQPGGPGGHSLSDLYPLTCPAWVTLPGVQDSSRHSSRVHGDLPSRLLANNLLAVGRLSYGFVLINKSGCCCCLFVCLISY